MSATSATTGRVRRIRQPVPTTCASILWPSIRRTFGMSTMDVTSVSPSAASTLVSSE